VLRNLRNVVLNCNSFTSILEFHFRARTGHSLLLFVLFVVFKQRLSVNNPYMLRYTVCSSSRLQRSRQRTATCPSLAAARVPCSSRGRQRIRVLGDAVVAASVLGTANVASALDHRPAVIVFGSRASF
jgi:hypothetical protein